MKLVSCASVLALSLAALPADAATKLVYKLVDSASQTGAQADENGTWTGTGGLNEGVAGANSLANTTIDYKDSWVDTNWADVSAVRTSIYSNGNEVAYIEFDATGTTKNDFFTWSNITSSSWSDLTSAGFTGNYFSIDGHTGPDIDRTWFVNQHYGGCGSDTGWMVVVGLNNNPCSWEDNRVGLVGANDRAFIFSAGTTKVNYNTSGIGLGDMFAVSVTYDAPAVPLPATGLLMAGAMAGFGALRRRKG